jgi:hypothetical protein
VQQEGTTVNYFVGVSHLIPFSLNISVSQPEIVIIGPGKFTQCIHQTNAFCSADQEKVSIIECILGISLFDKEGTTMHSIVICLRSQIVFF